jgi:glycosyltransferase involved in cell wall biosynthesis
MKKLLYIAPHLSTGGLPQFLTKKIQLLKDQYDLHIIEYDDHTGGVLVVQKERIQEVIPPEKFFVLGEDKMEVIDVIKKVKPDIIHLEEIPEMFMKNEVAEWIYRKDRDYLVVETSHDSSFNVEEKRFFPDKFFFISLWHFHQYKKLDIDKALVEYPLEFKDRPDRTKALEKLGLDPNKKHVLHVGLYTPRKNQKEFFEYARALKDYNIEFHSVGNQAGNFAFYWEPLMENKPENVTWWNERKDVDNFYSAMDLFLFTSRGTDKDKETMPLVIREALSWNMPQLLYNLPVYQSYWDHFDTIDYLKFDDFNKNCELIVKNLGLKRENINKDEEVVIISTFPS